MVLTIKCKKCQKPTQPINIFNGECVDCMIKCVSDDIDKCTCQFDISQKIPKEEFKDPLHEYGGYVFDKEEPHL